MARGRRGNGEGTIYQRGDGRWTGQATAGLDSATGKPRRVTVYGETRKEVVDKLDEKRRAIREGDLQAEDMRVGGLLDFWLARAKTQVARTTALRYDLDIRNLKPYLEGLKLSQMRGLHVTQLYQKMQEDGHSPDTIHKAAVRLRQALEAACRMGLLRDNPSKKMALPRFQKADIHPLTPEQVRHFLDVTRGSPFHVLYLTALDTGARQGELFALLRSDWNPERGELSITKSLTQVLGEYVVGPCKTRASRRTLRVTPTTAEALEGLLERPEGISSELLFTSPEGHYVHRPNLLRRFFYPDCRRAGIPEGFTFHDLRHTTATLLLLGGADVRTVAAQLGHADPTMVLRTYGHVLPAMRDRAASVMAGMLAPTQPQ